MFEDKSPHHTSLERVTDRSGNESNARRLLPSSSGGEINALKRELVAQLYTQGGAFWEAVREVRSRRGIVATPKHPSEFDEHLLFPQDTPNWPGEPGEPGYTEEKLEKWDAFYQEWQRDLNTIIRSVVQERYFDPTKKDPLPWQRFAAACVLYDPPETDLEALANYAGPYPQYITPFGPSEGKWPDTEEEQLLAVEPPIVQLRDGIEQSRIEERYWYSVLFKIWELHLKPQGLEFWGVLEEIDEKYPEFQQAHQEASRRNHPRHYIKVDEHTTEDDVRHAFRMISRMHESRPGGGRPRRDPLMALQCAILYDRHNERDPKDPRRKKWTYEKLAKRFGLPSTRSAKSSSKRDASALQKASTKRIGYKKARGVFCLLKTCSPGLYKAGDGKQASHRPRRKIVRRYSALFTAARMGGARPKGQLRPRGEVLHRS